MRMSIAFAKKLKFILPWAGKYGTMDIRKRADGGNHQRGYDEENDKEDKPVTTGEKIKRIRQHRKMTQKELGEAIGLGATGANRIAQYEMGYRVPKGDLLQKIAEALDVKVENFFVSDKFATDIFRLLLWFDFEHTEVFQVYTTQLDQTLLPVDVSTTVSRMTQPIQFTGNAVTGTGFESDTPVTVLWTQNGMVNTYLQEWAQRQKEYKDRQITRSEYCVWILQWPDSSDLGGVRQPKREWRKEI